MLLYDKPLVPSTSPVSGPPKGPFRPNNAVSLAIQAGVAVPGERDRR